MGRIFVSVVLMLASYWAGANSMDYYFSAKQKFSADITTPEQFLGYPVGDWHVRHDQLRQYMELLASQSPRLQLQVTGRTHEQRALLLLTVTRPERFNGLAAWQQQRQQRILAGTKSSENDPMVLWMGYSVHGDEPSGANAAMLVAYYLAAAQGPEIEQLLEQAVILLDPSVNPDGLDRFAIWANMHKGMNANPDNAHLEHNQPWVKGRPNHYWFDLNRDWLLLQHPESRARVKLFQQWLPNVLTDFHEMGTDSTFFFQPGIPSRKHPLTPARNVELTQQLAKFHAKALDEVGSLYFTEESFDDFYFGKGSTYPDIHGGVGILFEQGSSRGHRQNSINGVVEFPFTIRNQLLTSLSSFAGALANKAALQQYQAEFYKTARQDAKQQAAAGLLVDNPQDDGRWQAFLAILSQHHIQFQFLQSAVRQQGDEFAIGSVFIPYDQAQYRLLSALFSEQQNFADNTFYDVSAWHLGHAFNLTVRPWQGRVSALKLAAEPQKLQLSELPVGVAYAFSWQDYRAPQLLTHLLQQGVRARMATSAFTATTTQGTKSFPMGSVVIAGAQQPANLHKILQAAQRQWALPIITVASGLTPQGIDLGSRAMQPVTLPKVLIIGGQGIDSQEVGELWYHIDRFVGTPVTIVDQTRMADVDFANYSHVLLADGRYNLSKSQLAALELWVKQGGVLWAQKSAVKYVIDNKLSPASYYTADDIDAKFNVAELRYADRERWQATQRIAGAIFDTRVDKSHPLLAGINAENLPTFRDHNMILKAADVPLVTVAKY